MMILVFDSWLSGSALDLEFIYLEFNLLAKVNFLFVAKFYENFAYTYFYASNTIEAFFTEKPFGKSRTIKKFEILMILIILDFQNIFQ
jgi:hypothetical protein